MSLSSRKRTLSVLCAAGLATVLIAVAVIRAGREMVPGSYDPPPGLRLLYELQYDTSSETDFRSLLQEGEDPSVRQDRSAPLAAQRTATALRGRLAVTVIEAGSDRILWALRIEGPSVRVEINGRDQPAQAASVAAALARDWFASTDRRGRVSGALVAPDEGRLAAQFVSALLSQLQFVLPKGLKPGKRTWKTEEEGPNGTYAARYARSKTFDGSRPPAPRTGLRAFRKTKKEHILEEAGVRALLPRLPTTISPEGGLDVLFDIRRGYVEAMRGFGTERISVSGREIARVESSLSLRRLRTDSAPAADLKRMKRSLESLAAVADFASLAIVITEEESELAVQRAALGRETIDSLLDEMDRAEAEGRTRDTDLYLKFKALVYLHPEVSPALAAVLADSPALSPAWNVVAGALGTVGHAEAQDALADLIRTRRGEPEIVSRLVQTLAMVRFPTEQAERVLAELADDPGDGLVRSAALFGLGSMSRRIREMDPERAGRIADGLLVRIQPSLPEGELEVILKALGNSGSDKALPAFREYSRHQTSSLRAAAAIGLRFVEAAGAERLLIDMLRSDPEDTVRATALLAFSFRRPSRAALKAHVRAAAKDKSESVRIAALRNLGNMTSEFPEALDAVRRAAEKDPSEAVRKSAAALLPPKEVDRSGAIP